MKKIFGISLVAVLAAVPMMANAADGEPVAGDPGQTVLNVTLATNPAGYALAVQDGEKDGKMATAGYVKGAYNATIKAINKLASDTSTALDTKQDTISDISTIRSNATAGAGAAVAVGDMDDLEVENVETLVEAINAVKSTADSALTSEDLTDYATKQDVTTAINSATASGTLDVITTWGTDDETTVTISGSVSAGE